MSVIQDGPWCSVMHEDKGISVEAYLDWPSIKVFQVEIICSGHELFTCVTQNEALTSTHGESWEKSTNPTKCWKCEYL